MPWQKHKVRGENCGRHCKKWLRYDAIKSNEEAAKMAPDATDLVKIRGTFVDRTNAMFALDDGSGCAIMGFLYRDIKTTENPARLGESWSVWGHIERVPFEPDDGPPLLWTSPSHMTKLSPAEDAESAPVVEPE